MDIMPRWVQQIVELLTRRRRFYTYDAGGTARTACRRALPVAEHSRKKRLWRRTWEMDKPARHIGVPRAYRNRAILTYKAEHPEATLEEIGREFGLSRQRVWKILRHGVW